jgi:hypothetical protein
MSFLVDSVFKFLNCETINNQSNNINILLPSISNNDNILYSPIPIRSYYSTLLDENDMSKYQYIHFVRNRK